MRSLLAEILMIVLAAILSVGSCSAADSSASALAESYDNAVHSLTYRPNGKKMPDAERQWVTTLELLSGSDTPEADQYLARLALFSLDGVFAEEYGCAAAKRSQRFSRELRRQLERFESDNACHAFLAANPGAAGGICSTRKEFTVTFNEFRHLPLADRAGACDK
jgi:hypothetical protein